jgi:hypothetical protein
MLASTRSATLSVSALMLGTAATVATALDAGGAIPDSTQMILLRRAAAQAPVLIVRGDFGLRELRHPLIDSTGVRSASWERTTHTRPALFATPDAPRSAVTGPLAWHQISTLETQRPMRLKGTLIGGITGLAAGMLMVGTTDTGTFTGDYRNVGYLVGMPMTGAVAGFVIGSLSGFRTIYSAPSRENH